MTKVSSPLFGTSATGKIGAIGTFRMGRHGPEFIAIAKGSGGWTEPQDRLRACFTAAKAAHSLIEPTRYQVGKRWYSHRIPAWSDFWRQWLIDHPECTA